MKRLILILAALASSGLWAFAQTSPDAAQTYPSGQTSGAPSASPTSGGATMTVDGCLGGSNGNYTLKDKASGTTYNLTGDTAKLSDHVGHEVSITGTASSPSAGSAASAAATGAGSSSATLSVTSFKHVASTCSSGQ